MRFAPTTREIHARRLDAGAFKVCTRDITDAVGPTPRAAIGTSAPSPTRHLTKTRRRAALSTPLQAHHTRPTPPAKTRRRFQVRTQIHKTLSDRIACTGPGSRGRLRPERRLVLGFSWGLNCGGFAWALQRQHTPQVLALLRRTLVPVIRDVRAFRRCRAASTVTPEHRAALQKRPLEPQS